MLATKVEVMSGCKPWIWAFKRTFPKASENVTIDLDDGVKANYPKFGAALKKIPGLEATSD